MNLARSLAFGVVVLAAACDKTVPTPAGTTLVDLPTFTKMSITDWTVGAPTAPATKVKKSYRFVVGDLGPDVRFEVAFEHGPSELVDAKAKEPPPTVQTPRAIRITVLENTGWALSATCDPDLKVPLAVNPDGTSAYPKSVWATCTLLMKRKNGNITVAPWIEVHGDGKVVVEAVGTGQRVVEE